MIPGPMIFATIIAAGVFHKNGASKFTTQKTSLIPSCLSILDVEIPIQHQEPWCVDTRAIRMPKTGGRLNAYRPIFHDWKLNFTAELDTYEMSEKTLRKIVDSA